MLVFKTFVYLTVVGVPRVELRVHLDLLPSVKPFHSWSVHWTKAVSHALHSVGFRGRPGCRGGPDGSWQMSPEKAGESRAWLPRPGLQPTSRA